MIKHCLALKILCSLINLCWMHFPFSEMLLSPESTAGAMQHYQPDLSALPSPFLEVFCTRTTCHYAWGLLLLAPCYYCAPSPRVLWSWIWVLSLVWLEGARWRFCLCMMWSQATFSAHLRAFMVCNVSWTHEIISTKCSWWSAITKWLQELESSWKHTSTQKYSSSQILQPNHRAADTQLWCP